MRTIRTTLAAMLTVLTLAAFQSDAQAQARRSTTTSRTSSSNDRKAGGTVSQTRTSGTTRTTPKVSAAKTTRTTAPTVRTTVRTATKPSATRTTVRPETKPSTTRTTVRPASKPSTSVTTSRPAAAKPSPTVSPTRPSVTMQEQTTRTAVRPAIKPSESRSTAGTVITRTPPPASKPIEVTRPGAPLGGRKPGDSYLPPRIHPRDLDFMHYSTPSHFWAGNNHCYGHRVRVIPSYAHRYVHYGVTYYCYNDIWYRPFGGHYVVCRPPLGTVLAAELISDMVWTAVRLSYYATIANTYSQINENNEYIAQQNVIIAQNNATIAAQNAQIASGQVKAQEAYALADQLGLVQSYADAGSSYYYQDGVFYVQDKDGQYKVILPPAGALVETLPEDYDMVTLPDGKEYYKVDDTVYRLSVNDGKPLFEVLGQLYG